MSQRATEQDYLLPSLTKTESKQPRQCGLYAFVTAIALAVALFYFIGGTTTSNHLENGTTDLTPLLADSVSVETAELYTVIGKARAKPGKRQGY
jgi:hypothetical protein